MTFWIQSAANVSKLDDFDEIIDVHDFSGKKSEWLLLILDFYQ